MARLNFEEIGKDLEKKGVDSDTINTVKQTIADKMEPQTIDKAVLFLGWATVVLAVGGILLAGLGKPVPDALWATLGAGVGGLAGIFMGK